MSARKITNKIIVSLIFILLFTMLGDIIPRTIYKLRTFDSFVSELSYEAAEQSENGIVQVTAHRHIKQSVAAKVISELQCIDSNGVRYQVISGQENRIIIFDLEKGEDIKILYERVNSNVEPQRCKLLYLITLMLPYGQEKTKLFETNYFQVN